MNYLLDTCVISEFTKPTPNSRLVSWLSAQDEHGLCLSSIVIGELARGIARLPNGAKRRRLDAWLHADLRSRFSGRILPVNEEVALAWGSMSGHLQNQGQSLPLADGLIAATAAVNSLVVVTRNVRDMAVTGVPFLNPWKD